MSLASLRTRIEASASEHPWLPRALILAWLVWVWTGYFSSVPPGPLRSPFSGATLIVHEAGHAAFTWTFNELLTVAGGTIFQIAIPALVAWFFWHKRDVFACTVMLFWLGTSLVEAGIYASDARAELLPLVSPWGDEGDAQNDWTFMLMRVGKLSRDQTIGARIRGAGMIVMPFALAAGAWVVWMTARAPKVPGSTGKHDEEARLAASPHIREALEAATRRER